MAMNRQVEIKAEQIARLMVKGIPATRVAIEMGMSYSGLQRILRCPEYLQIEEQVRTGVLNKMDARLAARATIEDSVEDAVPEAMRVLLDAALKKRDLRAAIEVLDRDPKRQFSKSTAARPEISTAQSTINSEALSQAMREADLTHNILQNAVPQTTKAEA